MYLYAYSKGVKPKNVIFIAVDNNIDIYLGGYNLITTKNFIKQLYAEILNCLEVEYDEDLRIKIV